MKFNDINDKGNSLYHYTLFLLGLANNDTTSFPIEDFTRSFNSWYRRLVFLIWKNSITWEFDDSNHTTLPIATTDLVDQQQDYTLPTIALDVQRVEVKNSSGNFVVLKQFDKTQLPSTALSEFHKQSGMPIYYDIIGNSLLLYPKPDAGSVTLASGLQVHLARDIYAFAATDTTKEPGIEAGLHPYMAYGAALDYAMAKNLDVNKFTMFRTELQKYEDRIIEYANRRNRDFRIRIRPLTRRII